MPDDTLSDWLDADGRVKQWPSRKRHTDTQVLVLAYLASKLEPSYTYTEREISEVLRQWHTFEDWAMLRRELFERGYVRRKKDGSAYWLANLSASS
jgi:hypothetical protein